MCRGKQRAVDVLSQHGIGDDDFRCAVADALCLGIFVSTLDRQREQTVLIGNLGYVGLLVYIKGDGLFRYSLDSLQQVVVANGKTDVCVTLRQFELGLHHILAIRSSQVDCIALDVENEICQDGQGVFAVDDPCKGVEFAAKCSA